MSNKLRMDMIVGNYDKFEDCENNTISIVISKKLLEGFSKEEKLQVEIDCCKALTELAKSIGALDYTKLYSCESGDLNE